MGSICSIAEYADMSDQVMGELAERRTAVENDEKLWRCLAVTGTAGEGYLWIAGANEKWRLYVQRGRPALCATA